MNFAIFVISIFTISKSNSNLVIFRQMSKYKMYLNIKCHANKCWHFSFFIFKEITTSVVSFNRQDRLRLIGFDSSFDPNIIGQCINQHYQSAINQYNYCGATEFKLKGYPFHCSGMEAIKTRRLIVKVLVSIYMWQLVLKLSSGWKLLILTTNLLSIIVIHVVIN